MMISIKKTAIYILTMFLLVGGLACSTKKGVRYAGKELPKNSKVAVIVNFPNNIKNVVLSRFMHNGYKVKALNASDLYTNAAVFDIKDYKKISYKFGVAGNDYSLLSLQKSFNNIYKLHMYNFELHKAETLNEIKTKWDVQYLVLIDLKDWQKVSWGRAIDLNTLDIMWIENYPTAYGDNVETIVDHFIDSMSRK